MFDPKKFTTPTAKPLPVVLLLDVSSSMSGDKIENLNKAAGYLCTGREDGDRNSCFCHHFR